MYDASAVTGNDASEPFKPTVSVIIVSYNTIEQLKKCLDAVRGQASQVIVVDNASTDGSQEFLRAEPGITVLLSNRNLGFGAANNLGLCQATGDLVLFLNSDAYAHSGAVEELASNFSDADVVAVGGKLLNPDGSLQDSVAGPLSLFAVFLEQFFLDGIAALVGRSYWRTRFLSPHSPSEVHQVMGACLMVRRDANPKFDERFFLYCEDTELCHRLRQKGKIIYDPRAEFTHELGSSSINDRWRSVARYNLGKETFFRITQGQWAASICWLLNSIGAILRMIAGALLSAVTLLTGKGLHPKLTTFWRVFLARRNDLVPPTQ